MWCGKSGDPDGIGKSDISVMHFDDVVTVFFTVIALTDQLDVFEWIPLVVVRSVAIVLSVAFVAYMVLWDWKTRILFAPLIPSRRGA